jgi:hypothetical protein
MPENTSNSTCELRSEVTISEIAPSKKQKFMP